MFSTSNLDNIFDNKINPIPFFQKKNTFNSLSQESKFNSGGILCDKNLYGKCLLPHSTLKINNQHMTLDHFYHNVLKLESNSILKNQEREVLVEDKFKINSYDNKYGQITTQPILGILVQRIDESIKIIELENGSKISSTHKHRFLKLIN